MLCCAYTNLLLKIHTHTKDGSDNDGILMLHFMWKMS
jgi:hypothetical protein